MRKATLEFGNLVLIDGDHRVFPQCYLRDGPCGDFCPHFDDSDAKVIHLSCGSGVSFEKIKKDN